MQFSIPLYDALLGANIAPDKAKAVVEAFEKEGTDMISMLATKEDLRAQLDLLESRMTVKLGAMIVGAIGLTGGLVTALIKVL